MSLRYIDNRLRLSKITVLINQFLDVWNNNTCAIPIYGPLGDHVDFDLLIPEINTDCATTIIIGNIPNTLLLVHQQNVNRSGSHIQTSQTLLQNSPVLPSNSRCSQAPLELSKVLSDSASAVSGALESTCSYGGALMMPRDVTYRIVKFRSGRALCSGLRVT